MDEIKPQQQLDNERFLRDNSEFRNLPIRVQTLILKSPNASDDFMNFFAHGGKVVEDPAEPLAVYRAQPSPKIIINRDLLMLAKTPQGDFAAERLFSILAHEIGHDKDRNIIFSPHGTAEGYAQFCSEIEARAIFNAFPIFADLRESEPSLTPKWDAVGYDSLGAHWGALYKQWKDGGVDKEGVIVEAAKVVQRFPYTRDDGTGNQFKTWRDYYLDQFQQLKREGPTPSGPEQKADPSSGDHPDHAMHEDVRRRLIGLYAEQGLSIDGDRLERLTAGVMADARSSQMARVDLLEFSEDYGTGKPDVNGNIIAFQGDPANPASPYSATPIDKALQTPVEDSYRQFDAATQQQAQQWERFLAQEQELSQSRGMHRSL